MRIYKLLFLIIFICLIFFQCKKDHDSPTDHLYVYQTNGYLETRQYIRLNLSGDDSPKKRHAAFSITSHDRVLHKYDYILSIDYPSGAEATTYFDAFGKSNNNVTMHITKNIPNAGVWIPIAGQVALFDHSGQPHPAFFSKGHVSFSHLMCINTSSYGLNDTIIVSGELRYY